jgi:hypothetical protein
MIKQKQIGDTLLNEIFSSYNLPEIDAFLTNKIE